MKVLKLVLALSGLALTTFAQEKGIKFRDFENWEAVMVTAKRENKPVFVDFYTTWCAPCKLLEKNVYPDSAVGAYFNQHFIPVKIQLDKTNKDSEQVQKWYPEFDMLIQKFDIQGYPTLVFLGPDGEVRNLYAGYMSPTELTELATASLNPDQKYIPTANKYYALIDDYHKGIVDGTALVKVLYAFHEADKNVAGADALSFPGDYKVKDTLTTIVLAYLRDQPLSTLYTKEVLTIVGTVGVSSEDVLFKLFYPNSAKADKIVGQQHFSRQVVDRAIRREYFKRIPDKMAVIYKSEFNWDSLYRVVKANYNADYAQRAVDAAKVAVAYQTHDYSKDPFNPQYIDGFLRLIERHGPNAVLIYEEGLKWKSFDRDVLTGGSLEKIQGVILDNFFVPMVYSVPDESHQPVATRMMEVVVRWAKVNESVWFSPWSDTYAWLLVQAGQRDKALRIARDGLDFATKHSALVGFKEQAIALQESIDLIESGKVLWVANAVKN